MVYGIYTTKATMTELLAKEIPNHLITFQNLEEVFLNITFGTAQ